MLSCGQFLAEFGKHMEGDLPEEVRRELEAHLAECRTCQVVVDSTAKTLKVVTESGDFDLSEQLPEPLVSRIMDRVRDSGAGSVPPRPEPGDGDPGTHG